MKTIFISSRRLSIVLSAVAVAVVTGAMGREVRGEPGPSAPVSPPTPPTPDAAAPAANDDGLVDMDGDGDIDDDDRKLLASPEVISIQDKSAGTKLVESARAVTVIDLKKDRERTADLGEVLSRAHGVQVRRDGGLGSIARLSLNGLYDEQVRLFVDGIPLDFAGWGLGIANIPVELIQRVDVYRGVVPIGLGADALGGAVDLVTDPSWVDRASLSFEMGSFGLYRVSGGGRVRDDKTGLALSVSLFTDRAKNDYPIDVEATDDRGKLVPVNVRRFHDAYTAGGTIVEGGLIQRGPIERATVRAFFSQYAKELQHNTIMTVPYGDASYGGDSNGVSGELVAKWNAWSVRGIVGWSGSNTDFRDVGTNVYDWFGKIVNTRKVAGEVGTRPSSTRLYESVVFGRATAEWAVNARNKLRVALAPTATKRDGHDNLDTNPNGKDPIQAKRDVVQLVSGLEYERTAFDGKLENIGFVKDYRLTSDAEEARPGFVFVPIDRDMHHFGLGDSLRYKLAEGLTAKASYEWATRIPSVDELFGDGVLVQENLSLDPETSHNANLGLQAEGASRVGSWGGEVSGFARLADDLILLIGNDRVFSYQNVYAARILGVEGTAAWSSPKDWASLQASFTVQDIRNASSDGTFGAFEGDRIPNRPWLLGSVSGQLRWRGLLRGGDDLSVFGTSRYVHSFLRGWESVGSADSKQRVDSQLIHGVGVTYALRGVAPIVTTLELQNLTDARVFDSFGVQKPGRALVLKVSAEM